MFPFYEISDVNITQWLNDFTTSCTLCYIHNESSWFRIQEKFEYVKEYIKSCKKIKRLNKKILFVYLRNFVILTNIKLELPTQMVYQALKVNYLVISNNFGRMFTQTTKLSGLSTTMTLNERIVILSTSFTEYFKSVYSSTFEGSSALRYTCWIYVIISILV